MSSQKEKCVMFFRVSSREQREEGYSIEAQSRLLNDYKSRLNFKALKTFDMSETGSKHKERKLFNEMMSYTRKNDARHIICEKVDRITRNLKDAATIDDWLQENEQNRIHFVKDNLILSKYSKSNDLLQWDIKVALARHYSNNLSEEVIKGTTEKALQGWYPGGKKRGYLSVRPDGQKKAIWIQDETEQSELPYIKRAFELYAYGNHTLKTLRLALASEGWVDKDGKPIPKSTLAKLLSDPFYSGPFFWKGILYTKYNHKPIISQEVFEIVRKKINGKHAGKFNKHNHLFRGLIKCKECGGSYTGEIQKGHTYYRCTRHKPCSQRKYVREEVIEKQVMDELETIKVKNKKLLQWLQKALRESHQDEIVYHNQVLTSLNNRYQQLQERCDEIYLDKIDKRITLEKFETLEKKFRQEQKDVRKELERHEQANIKYFELGVNILELAFLGKKLYLSANPDKKRQILNQVFLNLKIEGENLLTVKKKPYEQIAQRAKNENWSGVADSNLLIRIATYLLCGVISKLKIG
ncbi:MAG: recombinase family protein [Patescibacteria group bacterium]